MESTDRERRAFEGIDIYNVQRSWRRRHGVPIYAAERFWKRTWQAEWPDCQRAARAYTRNGVLVKAVRRRLAEWDALADSPACR